MLLTLDSRIHCRKTVYGAQQVDHTKGQPGLHPHHSTSRWSCMRSVMAMEGMPGAKVSAYKSTHVTVTCRVCQPPVHFSSVLDAQKGTAPAAKYHWHQHTACTCMQAMPQLANSAGAYSTPPWCQYTHSAGCCMGPVRKGSMLTEHGAGRSSTSSPFRLKCP